MRSYGRLTTASASPPIAPATRNCHRRACQSYATSGSRKKGHSFARPALRKVFQVKLLYQPDSIQAYRYADSRHTLPGHCPVAPLARMIHETVELKGDRKRQKLNAECAEKCRRTLRGVGSSASYLSARIGRRAPEARSTGTTCFAVRNSCVTRRRWLFRLFILRLHNLYEEKTRMSLRRYDSWS